MKDYINVFLFPVIFQLILGIIVLTAGYSYSWGDGVYVVDDRWNRFIDNIVMVVFWIVLDFIYVQSMRYNRKRKEGKKED